MSARLLWVARRLYYGVDAQEVLRGHVRLNLRPAGNGLPFLWSGWIARDLISSLGILLLICQLGMEDKLALTYDFHLFPRLPLRISLAHEINEFLGLFAFRLCEGLIYEGLLLFFILRNFSGDVIIHLAFLLQIQLPSLGGIKAGLLRGSYVKL